MSNSAIDFTPPEASKDGQCSRLLAFLIRHGEICTITGRESLGIMAVATRIFELRRDGHRIRTVRGFAYDSQGRKHPNACYILQRAVQ